MDRLSWEKNPSQRFVPAPVEDVLPGVVIDPDMLGELLAYRHVAHPHIGGELRPGRVHVGPYRSTKRAAVDVRDDGGAGLPGGGVDECEDGGLVGGTAVEMGALVSVHVFRFAAYVGLVRHHGCVGHFGDESAISHRFANALRHEPGGAGAEPVLAFNLASGDTVFGRNHLEEHKHPLAERDLGTVEHGARHDGELLPAGAATPHPALAVSPGAGLAGNTVQG
jgi:hypothetical protein